MHCASKSISLEAFKNICWKVPQREREQEATQWGLCWLLFIRLTSAWVQVNKHISVKGAEYVPCIIQIYSVYRFNLSFSQFKFQHIIIIITSESFFIVFGLKAFLWLFSKAVRRAEIKSQPQKQTEVKELLPKRQIAFATRENIFPSFKSLTVLCV